MVLFHKGIKLLCMDDEKVVMLDLSGKYDRENMAAPSWLDGEFFYRYLPIIYDLGY